MALPMLALWLLLGIPKVDLEMGQPGGPFHFGADRLGGERRAGRPDHVLRAARAGLALHAAVEQAAAGREDWPRFRVGINTGPALVGNVGAQQVRNFTAIGDTMNLAARLEGLAEPGQVVIGPNTAVALGESARVRMLGWVDVKGKRDPVRVRVLDGLAP
ncbi:adenylate/guanylate cyclase domain-containing protein [Mycobacterium colombiense]|nr:adenylate/guanylate cyclase domain-containing protein [Mycobacterium colombiense]